MGEIEYKTIIHQVGQNDTVTAIIRKYNHLNLQPKFISKLLTRFYELNPDSNPPKMGQHVIVPILLGFDRPS